MMDTPVTFPALRVRGLQKRFGATRVIQGIDLDVKPGECMVVIGPNGAGKTTLFDLISGRIRPDAGSIWLHGRRIDGRQSFEIHRLGLSRSFQTAQVFPALSVFDNLRCALLWSLGYGYGMFRTLARLSGANERTRELAARIGLGGRRSTIAAHLTHAERRALDVGMAMATDAGVVLLDEPTSGMDRDETRRFLALIRELGAQRTLLVVEHDMEVAFGLADRIAVLDHGELVACDTPDSVRRNARVRSIYLGSAAAPGGSEGGR